ncbi:MAG: glycosyltransferase, partial [Candidatus Rokubacteria bacterium]|nr:glycosyltransferase [Candidatus Rokubacteria bacterium]
AARAPARRDGGGLRRELGLPVGAPLVGMVACLKPQKSPLDFVEVAARVAAAVPGAAFVLAGDGELRGRVQERADALGLRGRLHLLGWRRDIPGVMAALDVLVLPSVRSEATSQVISQALAVGTPVVASTVGGNPVLVRDGETGRLVAPGDARALAKAVLSLLADRDRARALARAGQAVVLTRGSIDVSMARTAEVYAELLGRTV